MRRCEQPPSALGVCAQVRNQSPRAVPLPVVTPVRRFRLPGLGTRLKTSSGLGGSVFPDGQCSGAGKLETPFVETPLASQVRLVAQQVASTAAKLSHPCAVLQSSPAFFRLRLATYRVQVASVLVHLAQFADIPGSATSVAPQRGGRPRKRGSSLRVAQFGALEGEVKIARRAGGVANAEKAKAACALGIGISVRSGGRTLCIAVSSTNTPARNTSRTKAHAWPEGNVSRFVREWMAPVVSRRRLSMITPRPNTGCICAKPSAAKVCPPICWPLGGRWRVRRCMSCLTDALLLRPATHLASSVEWNEMSTPSPSLTGRRRTWRIADM